MADNAAAAAPAAPAAPGEPARAKRPEGKNWVFTVNNPVRPFPDRLPRGVSYLVFQLERGHAGGTLHLQGYAQFDRKVRLSAVVACFEGDYACPQPRGHWEIARGTPAQNKEYCTKGDTRLDGPFEFGAVSGGQGARTDLVEVSRRILETGNAYCDPAVFLKYGSNMLKLAATVPPPRRDDLHVVVIVGSTGIGKSYAVRDAYPQVYCPYFGNSGLWWDGYNGQEVVLLEEFNGQVPLQKMLQVLDPYPLFLECKGGCCAARYKLIIITSNNQPGDWYHDPLFQRTSCIDALLRRCGASRAGVADEYHVLVDAKDRASLHDGLRIAFGSAPVAPVGFLGLQAVQPDEEAPPLVDRRFARDAPVDGLAAVDGLDGGVDVLPQQEGRQADRQGDGAPALVVCPPSPDLCPYYHTGCSP